VTQAVTKEGVLEELPARLTRIARGSFVADSELRSLIARGWARNLDKFLEDGILDEAEEARLGQLKDRFSLSQSELDATGALTKAFKAAVLRDVLNGVIPER
jgi:hypothetical protein